MCRSTYIDTHLYHFHPPSTPRFPRVHPLYRELMEFSFHFVYSATMCMYIMYTHILYYTGNLGESYDMDPTGCALVAF